MFNDYQHLKKELKRYEEHDWDSVYHDDQPKKSGEDWLKIVDGYTHSDSEDKLVNSPAHYTRGSQECIDTIEDAIQDAPSVITGNLQSYTLKYLIRLWLKEDPLKDAKKARWYLDRLISKLEKDN